MKKTVYQSGDVARKTPNKLLGQHFLRSQKALNTIIHASTISAGDAVLEIGPGEGVLTDALIAQGARVIAIEKDHYLAEKLREKYASSKAVQIIEGDALSVDIDTLVPQVYTVVANIPYYITSHMIRRLLDGSVRRPQHIVLLIQYEVAKRIVAHPPDMSLLGLSVQVFGHPTYVAKVPKASFWPAPRVDSAIVSISEIGDTFFTKHKIDAHSFFETTKKAFSQKRKQLRNSISYPSTKRPQELSKEDRVEIIRSKKL